MPTLYTTDSFCKISYHSPFAVHSHQLPMKAVTYSELGDPGVLTAWDGSTLAVDVMVKAMIDKLAEVVLSTTVYDKFTLYKWNTATLEYNPYYEEAYSVPGTATGLSGQARAVQNTLSIKTLGFSLLKIVFLDRPNNGTWGNQIPVPADYAEVVTEATALTNGWSGRDSTRPAIATNVSISLNKRLRRKYGMI